MDQFDDDLDLVVADGRVAFLPRGRLLVGWHRDADPADGGDDQADRHAEEDQRAAGRVGERYSVREWCVPHTSPPRHALPADY